MSETTSMTAGASLARASLSAPRKPAAVHPPGADAEGARIVLEVGVVQQRAGMASLVEALLVAQHVAVGGVVHDDSDKVDAELLGRGEVGTAEQEAAIAGDRHHGTIGVRHLDAERRREAVAQRAGEAGRDQPARLMDRIAVPDDVAQ